MPIDQQLSSRPVTSKDVLDFLNRELTPIVGKIRDAIVSRIGTSIGVSDNTVLVGLVETVLVDTTAGNIALYLQPAAAWSREMTIIKASGGPNVVNIVPFGTETISGSAPLPITAQYAGFRIRPILGTWYVVGTI